MIRAAAIAVAALGALAGVASAQTAPPLVDAMMSDGNIALVKTLSRLIDEVCLPIANDATIPSKGGEAWLKQHGLVPLGAAGAAALETELQSKVDAGSASTVAGFDGQLQVAVFEGARCRILLRRSPLARTAQIGLGLELGQKPDWLTVRVRDTDALFVRREAVAAKRVAQIQRVSDAAGTDDTLQLVITVAAIPETVLKR